MNKIIYFSILALIAGCAQKTIVNAESSVKPSDDNKNTALISTYGDSTHSHTLSRKFTFSISEDQINTFILLRLPEVDMKNNPKGKATSKFDPMNGNVCIVGNLTSSMKKNYSKEGWRGTLQVNGVNAKLGVEDIVQQEMKNSITGTTSAMPEAVRLWICTKDKFLNVKEVIFALQNKNGEQLINLKWSAPWPEF